MNLVWSRKFRIFRRGQGALRIEKQATGDRGVSPAIESILPRAFTDCQAQMAKPPTNFIMGGGLVKLCGENG
jgi:hypothetical protein